MIELKLQRPSFKTLNTWFNEVLEKSMVEFGSQLFQRNCLEGGGGQCSFKL